MKYRDAMGWLLVILALSSCRNGCHPDFRHRRVDNVQKRAVEKIDTTALGEVRVGKELVVFYVALGFDSAVLGFSVSPGAGPVRYFPIYASTDRGIPSVVLEVFASSSEEEMWVRSSWKDNETLAYHRIGTENTLAAWGEMKFIERPMPDYLSGGPLPFPELPTAVVRKAIFNYDEEHKEIPRD
jgi:hypothetical protein